MVITADFWRERRVFLTGHTGFKGGWLALWLQRLGARVVGYALTPPTTPNLYEVARVGEDMVSLTGDVRDLASLTAALRAHRPEVVIHMAAQPLVRASYDEPVETYATNVMGTVHVLEAARATHDVRVILCVTSDKCYENREWLWGYREDEPMGGFDPYSSSKGCAELVTTAYRRSFFSGSKPAQSGIALASARAGNVIGGGDWARDRLMTDLMAALITGQPALIRNPLAIRPWQYVLEPLRGYLMLIERLWAEGPSFAEGWNFGPEEASVKPVGWIADRLVEKWGAAAWRQDGTEQPHEAHLLRLDSAKARARLGWVPAWDLERGLEEILAWWRAYLAQADMRAVCWSQIAAYEADAAAEQRG